MQTLKACMAWGRKALEQLDTPELDIKCLLKEVTGFTDAELITRKEDVLTASQIQVFQQFVEQRISGKPIALILGKKDFWNLTLKVTEDTLVPRPETEILVEYVLDNINHENIRLVDLGTGTGAIALSLAKAHPKWHITATDKSAKALAVAKENAKFNKIQNVEFKLGEWFIPLHGQKFNIIVSNPPYIPINDPHLSQAALQYEPLSALASGHEGLDDIYSIVKEAKKYLMPHGLLALEHGFDQSDQVQVLLKEQGFLQVETIRDLAGLPRVTVGWGS